MDSNEINSLVTAKFAKISEQIKESLALLTQTSDPFPFSEPEEPVESISVLTSVCIPKFSFCEPFQKPKVEDSSIIDELIEIISSLSIHGSEYESTTKLEFPLKSTDEVKNDIQTISDGFEDSDTVPWVKSSTEVVSTDNKQNTQIKYEPWDCFDNPFIFTSVQIKGCDSFLMDCFEEKYKLDTNYQALNVRYDLMNGLAEQVDDINDNNESGTDVDSCHIPKENHRIIQGVLCNEEQDIQVDCNEVQNIQVDCNKIQDIDNNSISNRENIHASSAVQNLDSHNAEQDIAKEVLQKDENENIPLSKIPIDDGRTKNVEVLTPNDNSPTHVCRSGDLDPNTQITHVELDSPVAPPPKIYESQPLPFLVKDVHKITWPNQEEVVFPPVSYLFGQTFKSVMIYGLVTSLTVEQGGLKQRFVIDDGSDSINVVWKASDQIVGSLNHCKLRYETS